MHSTVQVKILLLMREREREREREMNVNNNSFSTPKIIKYHKNFCVVLGFGIESRGQQCVLERDLYCD